jgi:hypothetical protein
MQPAMQCNALSLQCTADMVEKEAKRLEVMKRRQERELSQLISYEMMRKEMQEKAQAKVRGPGYQAMFLSTRVWKQVR